MNITREPLLAALRRATDPRGLAAYELAAQVGAGPEEPKLRHRIRALLAELMADGEVERSEGGRYRIVGWRPAPPAAPTPRAMPSPAPAASGRGRAPAYVSAIGVEGRIRVHPAGYGFVQRDDGEDDVFIGNSNRGGALDGDRVLLDTWRGFKGTEGKVVEVIERGRARITGLLAEAGRSLYLSADDPRIQGHVALDGGGHGARVGQCVVAEITQYPTEPGGVMHAKVVHVLGDPDDPATEVGKVIAVAGIPDEFPAEVVAAGDAAAQQVLPEDAVDRADLRDRAFLTIDPETARDFDDAVCVEDGPRPGLERLWVAIADVSHYVRPGTALDAEAQKRGCSVYLPNRAIPMLPHPLSAGICSLNPDVDRCAMVARLDIDGTGAVVDTAFVAALIRSRARLDYPGVAAALGGDLKGPRAMYEPHLPQLRRLHTLSRRLRALRSARGSLDFDLPEAKVILDEDDPRRVRDVVKSRGNAEVKEAYRLVEDCMLAANEAVAHHFASRGLPTLYRVHDVPTDERLGEFAALANSFGIPFSVEEGRSPKRLRDFLRTIEGRPMERSLSYLLLRTLKQAAYDVVNVGHFGLAAPEYLHFTSPIRRYPDLVVHRLLKASLKSEGLPAGGGMHGPAPREDELAQTARLSSQNERRAMEAEREVVDMYRTFLMRDRVGDEYEGTIVGVTSFGVFVEIAQPFVEGLVKTERLSHGERFFFDERSVRLVSTTTGRSFALGDRVMVRIDNVSVQRRKIDMALLDHTPSTPAMLPASQPGSQPGSQRSEPRGERPAAARKPGARPQATGDAPGGRKRAAGPDSRRENTGSRGGRPARGEGGRGQGKSGTPGKSGKPGKAGKRGGKR